MLSAYVPRPKERGPTAEPRARGYTDRFDLVATDFVDLADTAIS
jgi:hypothetical protein